MLWVLVSRTPSEYDGLSFSMSTLGRYDDMCTYTVIFCHVFVEFESILVSFSFDSGVAGLEINVWYCFENANNCCLFHC